MSNPPLLRIPDVARIWGEERARADARRDGRDEAAAVAAAAPLATSTVESYVKHSRPAQPGRRARRYETNPVPGVHRLDGQRVVFVPDDGETLAALEQRLRDWWHSRPGPGVGGGRPPKQRGELVACPCGCNELVAPGSMCDRSAAEQAKAAKQ